MPNVMPVPIEQVWGATPTNRWPEAVDLVEGTAGRLLSEIGIPRDPVHHIALVDPLVEHDGGLVEFANDSGFAPICIERASGRVVCVDTSGRRLMNSSLEATMRTIAAYRSYGERVVNMSNAEADAFVEECVVRMEAIDPEAWKYPEAYWPIIAEQMRWGHL